MEYLHVGIEIGCVKLEIIGNYWPGEAASRDSPGESELIEIDKILTEKGDDIGGMVAHFDDLQKHVEEAAMEAFKAGRSNAAMERRIAA